MKEPILRSSTLTSSKPGKAVRKIVFPGRKFLALLPALIILSAIGYFLSRDHESARHPDATKHDSAYATQGMPDAPKGKSVSSTITKAKLQLESVDNVDRIRVIIDRNQGDNRDISYKYEWFKNSKPLGIKDDSVTGFKQGDSIGIRITPFDNKRYGRPVFLNMDIAHVPPKIVENKTISFDGNVLNYQVKAVDPDGGTLSYSLTDAPKDMTIDSGTGIITWRVKTNEYGKYSVNVVIKNSGGAEIVYPLSIDIDKISEQRAQISCSDHRSS